MDDEKHDVFTGREQRIKSLAEPSNAITAEMVRRVTHTDREVLCALLTHPGVSSTARAVIEAQVG